MVELPQVGMTPPPFADQRVSRVRIVSFILTSLPGEVLPELSPRTSGALS
jgi:hypothetical protein